MGFFDNFPGLNTSTPAKTTQTSPEKQTKFVTPVWVWIILGLCIVATVVLGIYSMKSNNPQLKYTRLKNIN